MVLLLPASRQGNYYIVQKANEQVIKLKNRWDLILFHFFNFILLTLPQGQGHHNSLSQLLWARTTYPTLSTFPVGGNLRGERRVL